MKSGPEMLAMVTLIVENSACVEIVATPTTATRFKKTAHDGNFFAGRFHALPVSITALAWPTIVRPV
jgi:hypothetical protein